MNQRLRRIRHALYATVLLSATLAARAESPDADWDAFPPDVSEVSEGELRFLEHPPARFPRIENRLRIDAHSVTTGWVEIEQCYRDLDAVPKSEIVYRYAEMRGLLLRESAGIAQLHVHASSVALEAVERGAHLCVALQARILRPRSDGVSGVFLANGPFHRQFLDGYYPLQVTLEIDYHAAGLALERVQPTPRPGLAMHNEAGRLSLEALFEGRLTFEVYWTMP